MKEVSPIAYQTLLSALMSRGNSPLEWIGTLPVSFIGLQLAQANMDWEIFAVLCDRFTMLYGSSNIPYLENWLDVPRPFFRFVTTPQYLYHQIPYHTGPALASNLIFKGEILASHRLKLTVEIPEPYQPSAAFFSLFGEALRRTPRLLQRSDALIEIVPSVRCVTYTIILPRSLSFRDRLSMAYHVLFYPRTVIEE
jgi:hypothetical protein